MLSLENGPQGPGEAGIHFPLWHVHTREYPGWKEKGDSWEGPSSTLEAFGAVPKLPPGGTPPLPQLPISFITGV